MGAFASGDMFQPILYKKSRYLETSILQGFCRYTDMALAPQTYSGFSQPHSATTAAFLEKLLPWAVCMERSCCPYSWAKTWG